MGLCFFPIVDKEHMCLFLLFLFLILTEEDLNNSKVRFRLFDITSEFYRVITNWVLRRSLHWIYT